MAQMKGMDICDIVVEPCHQSRSKIAVTKPLQFRLGTPSGAPGGAARAADATMICLSLTASQSVGVSFGGMPML